MCSLCLIEITLSSHGQLLYTRLCIIILCEGIICFCDEYACEYLYAIILLHRFVGYMMLHSINKGVASLYSELRPRSK